MTITSNTGRQTSFHRMEKNKIPLTKKVKETSVLEKIPGGGRDGLALLPGTGCSVQSNRQRVAESSCPSPVAQQIQRF